jgi:hypothetical protein
MKQWHKTRVETPNAKAEIFSVKSNGPLKLDES